MGFRLLLNRKETLTPTEARSAIADNVREDHKGEPECPNPEALPSETPETPKACDPKT